MNSLQCGHKINSSTTAWTVDESLRESFVGEERGFQPPVVKVDLDLPASERWKEVGKVVRKQIGSRGRVFSNATSQVGIGYYCSSGERCCELQRFRRFRGRNERLLEALGLDLGYVVAANLVYQLEHIGVNCSNWNATGPTNACKKKSKDIVWLESEWNAKRSLVDRYIRMCTSVVANNEQGEIIHGRNLDWNLPEEVKQLLITVEFHRNSALLYKGTDDRVVRGLLNAMRPYDSNTKTGGFTFSMDARCQGGLLFYNLLEALIEGSMTPCQHSRLVMENSNSFEEAVKGFETGNLINDGYFIVGGMKSSEGAVVSRDRNRNADTWRIDQNTEHGSWYVLETNYDHWEVAPSADDRRTPRKSAHDTTRNSRYYTSTPLR